ncbi:host range and adsorption protein [Enterobacter phage EcpYZU01]|uniref:host range and adsorption protein n=1 Tax=Enterobacter phage EcpYZU01 TaxID=2483604 RepID=UPI0018ACDCB0|nr:host range and adsorption protein [Enterobacter phage EcpYZU01]
MGKSISKAFKKVVGGALSTVGLAPSAPQPAQQVVDPAAAPVDVPTEQAQEDTTMTTEADSKKAKRVGKKSLQVSRTSGGGISL